MSNQIDGEPLHMSVAAQLSVVNNMVVPLLKQTGMDVDVAETKEGLTLAVRFAQPPEFDADNCGTDNPANAHLWWTLKDRIEAGAN